MFQTSVESAAGHRDKAWAALDAGDEARFRQAMFWLCVCHGTEHRGSRRYWMRAGMEWLMGRE